MRPEIEDLDWFERRLFELMTGSERRLKWIVNVAICASMVAAGLLYGIGAMWLVGLSACILFALGICVGCQISDKVHSEMDR